MDKTTPHALSPLHAEYAIIYKDGSYGWRPMFMPFPTHEGAREAAWMFYTQDRERGTRGHLPVGVALRHANDLGVVSACSRMHGHKRWTTEADDCGL